MGSSVSLRHEDAKYEIEVMNPEHVQSGVVKVELDGRELAEHIILLDPEPVKHTVRVWMGAQPA